MDIANIDLHRISLGALIIALGLLVDDDDDFVDAMLRRLGAGDSMDDPRPSPTACWRRPC